MEVEVLEQKIRSLEDKLQVRYDMQQKAEMLANSVMNARLEGMNEFREAMKDQSSKYITREEIHLMFVAQEKGRRDNIALFISVAAFLISIIKLFI